MWGVRLGSGSWGVGLGWSRVLCKYCVKSVGAGVWCVGVGRGECVQWGLGGVGLCMVWYGVESVGKREGCRPL